MKGYKVFRPDFTAKEGNFQYTENQTFEVSLPIQICSKGLHFCIKAQDCFSYYPFSPENIVCEVEALGETKTHDEDSKVCTNILKVGRCLTWAEVLEIANTGKDNTGHSNSGDSNSGDRNSGDSNSGDRNSGDRNSGYSNSGDRNSGDRNSGDSNSGDSNSGDRNSGDSNSGDRNSGDRNSGDSNSGDSNSGDRNSGDRNSGDRNSGDSNSGYRNSGAFCTDRAPELYLFDKPTGMNVVEWENHRAVNIMSRLLDFTIWIDSINMSAEEKERYPKHETTGGYLKTKTVYEAWTDMWGNLKDEEKKVFTTLPNFDASKFEEITGIKI